MVKHNVPVVFGHGELSVVFAIGIKYDLCAGANIVASPAIRWFFKLWKLFPDILRCEGAEVFFIYAYCFLRGPHYIFHNLPEEQTFQEGLRLDRLLQ